MYATHSNGAPAGTHEYEISQKRHVGGRKKGAYWPHLKYNQSFDIFALTDVKMEGNISRCSMGILIGIND
jgi:hypothetical protein